MANKKILVGFLRQQSQNRTEQANHRMKDHKPDAILVGKLRNEASLLGQAADICEASNAYGNGPAITEDQALRGIVPEPEVEAPPVVVAQAEKRKPGRPKKMTLKQIAEAGNGRAVAAVADIEDKDL